MRLKLLLISGIVVIAAAVAIAVSKDFTKKETPDKSNVKGEFYKASVENPIKSSSELDVFKGGTCRLSPVLQGDVVEHDIFFKNTTGKPVEFKDVKSCCGVILTGHSDFVAPGETGRFSFIILTDKFGGKTVKGRVTAEVSDPGIPMVSIPVILDVNKVADLSQYKIVLEGSCRNAVSGSTMIVPEKAYPFSITGIKAKKGLHIATSVERVAKEGKTGFIINVKNTLNTKGVYRDTLYVLTDNPKRPEIRVRVEGHITD
jgi:hypothetical protein